LEYSNHKLYRHNNSHKKIYLLRKQEVIDDDIKKVYWLMTSITLVRMLADSFGSLIYEQYKSQLFVVNQSINFG